MHVYNSINRNSFLKKATIYKSLSQTILIPNRTHIFTLTVYSVPVAFNSIFKTRKLTVIYKFYFVNFIQIYKLSKSIKFN